MNQDQRAHIIQEVARFTRPPRLEPHEFTTRQYAQLNNLTHAVAARQLANACDNGLLTRRQVIHNGKRAWAYRVAQHDAEENSND